MTKYETFAEALLNDSRAYGEYLKDPAYYVFLNQAAFTREDTLAYLAAVSEEEKRRG